MCINHDNETITIENFVLILLFFQANVKEIESLLVEKDDQANLEYLKMKLPLVQHYRLHHVCKKENEIKFHYAQVRSSLKTGQQIIAERYFVTGDIYGYIKVSAIEEIKSARIYWLLCQKVVRP